MQEDESGWYTDGGARIKVYSQQWSTRVYRWGLSPGYATSRCGCGWVILEPDFQAGRCLQCDKEFL